MGNSFCTITRDFMVVNFPLEFEALTWTIVLRVFADRYNVHSIGQ